MTNVIKWIESHKPANFKEARIRLELMTANYEKMNTIQELIKRKKRKGFIDDESQYRN